MDAMTEVLREFLRHLMKIGAVKIEPSYLYVNLHTANHPNPGPLTQDDIDTVAALMWRHACEARATFAGISGVPQAGLPFAKAVVAEAYHLLGDWYPYIALSETAGPQGQKNWRIMNTQGLPGGEKVLLVDDLIIDAESQEKAIECLRGGGYTVSDALVFFDRGRGGHKELSKIGVKLHSIVTVGAMVDFYNHEGFITREVYERVKQYLAQNSS